MRVARVVVALLTLVLATPLAESANILGIFSYSFSTPYLVVTPYVQALLRNGHNLTMISPAENLQDIPGVRHIRVPGVDELISDLMNSDYDPVYTTDKWQEAKVVATYFYNVSRLILSNPGVRALLQDQRESFEIVLMDPLHSDALYGIAEHFNAALVGISTFGSSWMIDYSAGNLAPSSYSPMSPLGYTRGSSFMQRWNNWIYIVEEWLTDRLVFLPGQLELFSQHFPFPTDRLYDRRKSFSLILINQHFSLGRVRSNVPNVIEVAGMHLAPPSRPLDPELLRFLDEAEHGVIYFSLGMEIINRLLPKDMQHKLLTAFSQLEQRVVWKHEMNAIANKSENVYLSAMVSQRELLEHRNVKLFITHGGLLSLIEAAYSGVPMLGLPMYYDQFDNIERMRQAGVAQSLNINTMTVEELKRSIRHLLENPCYSLRAKELSTRFRDQPVSPLDKAVWWTEYVLRHKGAPHMRLAEQDLPIAIYYNLNFIAVLCARIGLTLLILWMFGCVFVSFIISFFRRSAFHH
ncbi:hypothetical protein KR222_010573 [Zaprionus bogoriensis]|nr:hypothetical protein KR222_010573 [Zaprionus bogoriensis]